MEKKQGTRSKSAGGIKVISSNPLAYSNYFIDEVYEAGLVLTGTEVKSLRAQAPNLRDSYIEVVPARHGFEAYLVNAHIGPYSHGNIWNHLALRRRKLLLHSYQLQKLHGCVTQKGLSLVPVKLYFKGGIAKIEFGTGKGKKKYDKRADLKKEAHLREMRDHE